MTPNLKFSETTLVWVRCYSIGAGIKTKTNSSRITSVVSEPETNSIMFKVIIFACILAAVAADVAFLRNSKQGPQFRILRLEQDVDPSGSYKWAYETENGIAAEEQGHLQQGRSSQEPGIAAQGSYSYTSPEGVPVAIVYVADENGFQPQGNAIPTPPPIPAAIAKALEWIKAHPEPQENEKLKFRF